MIVDTSFYVSDQQLVRGPLTLKSSGHEDASRRLQLLWAFRELRKMSVEVLKTTGVGD